MSETKHNPEGTGSEGKVRAGVRVQKAASFDDWLREKLRSKRFRGQYRQAKLAAEIAHAITTLRQQLRMSQSALARRMGTKQQTISRLESGDYEGFTLKTLQKIAEATRTDLSISFKPARSRGRIGTA
jgi:transcriptional regulator with XRE-family HTH domain